MVNNKVDAFSKVFLATTVSCARCHDHKREAVSQRDYYALGAVFMTPRWVSRPADAPQKNVAAIAKLRGLRDAIRQALADQWSRAAFTSDRLRSIVSSMLKAEKPPQLSVADIAYPLSKLLQENADVTALWKSLVEEYRAARAARIEQNGRFEILADFKTPELPAGWVIEGDGMQSGWVEEGTPLVALEGAPVISRLLPRGYHTHALSSKLPGVLRMPPQHTVPGKITSLSLAGGQYSGSLVLDENSFQNETVAFFNLPQPTWRSYADAGLKNGVTRVTVDFATASLNANFPPRTGLAAGLPHTDPGFDKRSWLSITGIVTHDAPGATVDTLDAFVTLWDADAPAVTDRSSMETRLVQWLKSAVDRWCRGEPRDGDVLIVNWLLDNGLLTNQAVAGSSLSVLLNEYRSIEQSIQFPRTVNSMDERLMAKAGIYFNVRGNVDAMGELVPPGSLSMFAATQPDATENTGTASPARSADRVAASTGSGRLELAESLLEPSHPLTSRVYVNRLWQWMFGVGLVSTPDDFGRLGDQPSHPELLDWLARDFMRQGWSTKRLVRQLVMSQAFRQSSQVSPEAAKRDPGNRLRHHYATRRLEAEAIRDSLLAVSGRLDPQLYGRPINPPRLVEDAAKRLFSGPVDGHGRRSLYLTMSIMAPPKFLTTFDLPDLKLPSGKRNVTSVPSQALQLMNDPLVSQLAEHWAERLVRQGHASIAQRLDAMFIQAYARLPQADQRQAWQQFAAELATESDVLSETAVWTQVAHAIFNTQEFIYYR
ncbi:MAG: DUF1553 domain-containing protein, partial [Pirellulaceae bacterium]|nr:DUF1553 domain-containing protein [Pirellulaceae bacterium]